MNLHTIDIRFEIKPNSAQTAISKVLIAKMKNFSPSVRINFTKQTRVNSFKSL